MYCTVKVLKTADTPIDPLAQSKHITAYMSVLKLESMQEKRTVEGDSVLVWLPKCQTLA